MSMTRLAVCFATIVFVVACGAEPHSADESADPVERGSSESTSGEALALPGAVVDQPAGWLFRPPSSSMRLAEAEVAGPTGPAGFVFVGSTLPGDA